MVEGTNSRSFTSLRAAGETGGRLGRPPGPAVLVADSDPLSRHVLGTTLRDSGMVLSVTAVDAARPLREWRLDGVEVVLWSISPGVDISDQVRTLTSKGMRVVLLSPHWKAEEIRSALTAGAAGLVTKDANPYRLVVAISAAAVGYTLVNSELDSCGLFPTGLGGRFKTRFTTKPDAAQRLLDLSDREFEVLSHLAAGLSTPEVAQRMGITATTVKSHVSHTLTKLQVRNRVEAVLAYQRTITQHSSDLGADVPLCDNLK
ncbi:response regulator transcription factor [Streptomyces luteolus]|uniref:Response regulator transcription factor n=1 Tax=Streptomyces luteolus TaxID=3043615 RepID=A0ABT6T9B2_9ACTN|nr:response regulator transcription factor [Streptomyces sp. B-S-A12]MDI3424295.1 response regulator transcription factor [Streptomyces sp. B-S-A12]